MSCANILSVPNGSYASPLDAQFVIRQSGTVSIPASLNPVVDVAVPGVRPDDVIMFGLQSGSSAGLTALVASTNPPPTVGTTIRFTGTGTPASACVYGYVVFAVGN